MLFFLPHLFFFFYCYRDHRDLHSFPTRRSSDLRVGAPRPDRPRLRADSARRGTCRVSSHKKLRQELFRSEEHTSELQSRENLVCRLLLEKKKKKKIQSSEWNKS